MERGDMQVCFYTWKGLLTDKQFIERDGRKEMLI